MERIAEIAREHSCEDKYLRLRVLGGGCAGFSYDLLFVEQASPGDELLELPGRNVLVDPYSLDLIRGLQVEYVDEVTTEGLRFHNPNAIAVCGCGTSFAVEKR